MKPKDVDWLKELLAADRGVAAGDISDQEVIARYKRRWRKFFIGLLAVASAYFALRVFVSSLAARGFVALAALTSLAVQLHSCLRFAGHPSAGHVLAVKKQVAEKLHITVDQIGDAPVQEYDRRDQRSFLRGLSVLVLVWFLADWAWPNVVLETIALVTFYIVITLWASRAGSRRQGCPAGS